MIERIGAWRGWLGRTYERHERRWDLIFFVAGFLFDILASREGVDHALLIVQQVVYLVVIGATLYLELVSEANPAVVPLPSSLHPIWPYRSLWLHFCLGTLMNLYSLFFLISASLSSSVAFVALLFGAVAANESKALRKRGINVPIALYVLTVFCFFSIMIPIAVGRVGLLPFVAALTATVATVVCFAWLLRRRLDARTLRRRFVMPGLWMCAGVLGFYLVGFIPPVPLAAKKLGIYHDVVREGDTYLLSHQRPAWQFWREGDEDFVAQPGDRLYAFVAIFSPARFDDQVIVRWQHRDPTTGWQDSDRIPIRITGGRREGFRGFTAKENYSPGEWRVKVETTDGREIGRLGFTVRLVPIDPTRTFVTEQY